MSAAQIRECPEAGECSERDERDECDERDERDVDGSRHSGLLAFTVRKGDRTVAIEECAMRVFIHAGRMHIG
jgi:hypothetical protein